MYIGGAIGDCQGPRDEEAMSQNNRECPTRMALLGHSLFAICHFIKKLVFVNSNIDVHAKGRA